MYGPMFSPPDDFRATEFKIDYDVTTPQGSVVVVRWSIMAHNYMVTGANLLEAMRAAVLLEEDRAKYANVLPSTTVVTGGM